MRAHGFWRGVTRDGGTLVAKPKMWGQDAQGQSVHRTGDEEQALPKSRGMCTGANTEAGKRRRAAATRIWWAMCDPKARRRYMSAVATQVDKMRRLLRAELARQQRDGLV